MDALKDNGAIPGAAQITVFNGALVSEVMGQATESIDDLLMLQASLYAWTLDSPSFLPFQECIEEIEPVPNRKELLLKVFVEEDPQNPKRVQNGRLA